MKTPQELLKATTCYVNGQEINGRVLAVSTCVDRQSVCFLFPNETIGRWLPETALDPNESADTDISLPIEKQGKNADDKKAYKPSFSNKKNRKNYLSDKQTNRIKKEAQTDIYELIDNLTNTPIKLLDQTAKETNQAINEVNRQISRLAKGTQETAIQLAQETHKTLVKSVSETTGTISKVSGDTHATVIRLFNDTCAITIKVSEDTTAAFIQFPNNAYLTVRTQAEYSTKTLVKIIEDTQNSINNAILVAKNLTDAEIIARLNTIISIVHVAIKPVFDYISSQWNRYWKERILNAIKGEGMDRDSARKIVTLLREDFPNESNRELSNRLIEEKSLFATIVSLISATPVGATIKTVLASFSIEILNMTDLIVEMIYQISCIYGFHEVLEFDIFAIIILCFSPECLQSLDLSFLLDTSSPILPTWGIEPVIYFMLLLIIGYMACEFFELTSQKINPLQSEETWKTLEATVEVYTEQVVSQKQELQENIDQSILEMAPA